MIKGYTFQAQLFDSQSWAHIINVFLDKQNGITKGCAISNTADSITIQNGFFVTYGRLSGVIGQELIEVDATISGELFARLVYEVDLNQANTTTEFNQGSFKVLTSPSAYPALTQEDLDAGGMIYQLLFAEFKITTLGITNFVDKRVFLTLESAQSVFQATFEAFMAGLEAETYVSQAELTSALENKVNKPESATGDNIAIFDADQNAIKDSLITKGFLSSRRSGVTLARAGGAAWLLPGYNYFFTSRTPSSSTGVVWYIPIYVEKQMTVVSVGSYHGNTTSSNLEVAIYSENNGLPDVKMTSTYTIIGGTSTGDKETTITPLVLNAGIYFIGCVAKIATWSGSSAQYQSSFFSARSTSTYVFSATTYIFTQNTANLPSTANASSLVLFDTHATVMLKEA